MSSPGRFPFSRVGSPSRSSPAHLLLSLDYATTPRTIPAPVERVSDGDTSTAPSAEGTELRLRLLGIEAPEIAHETKPG